MSILFTWFLNLSKDVQPAVTSPLTLSSASGLLLINLLFLLACVTALNNKDTSAKIVTFTIHFNKDALGR